MKGEGHSLPKLLILEKAVCSLDNVLQQHGNGHGANTAWNGGNDGSDLNGRVEVDVTYKSLAGLACSIGNVVGSYIDDNSTRLQPLALDKVGSSNGNDDNVGVLEVGGEIARRGVAHGDGGIGSVQELCNRATDNVAAANNHSILASKLNASFLQQGDDTLGSAGSEDGLAAALGKLANVVGSKAVNILLVSDSRGDACLRDVLGERQLDKDAVDSIVVVKTTDLIEELDLGNVLWEVKQLAVDAGLETAC